MIHDYTVHFQSGYISKIQNYMIETINEKKNISFSYDDYF